jgi:GMP synthase PP-ATPase subunit
MEGIPADVFPSDMGLLPRTESRIGNEVRGSIRGLAHGITSKLPRTIERE